MFYFLRNFLLLLKYKPIHAFYVSFILKELQNVLEVTEIRKLLR